MGLAIFFQQIFVLFLIGFTGYFARRRGILNEHANQVFTQLILSLTLPLLILYAMDQPLSSAQTELFWLLPMSVFILAAACFIAFYVRKTLRISTYQQSVFEGVIIFGNQGFIGYALVVSLFPDFGALYVTLFNLPYLILIWTYGVYLFINKNNSWKSIFLNPGILATLLGLIIFLLPIRWPAVLSETFQLIGNMTIPLSMLVIGTFVADMNLNRSVLLSILRNKLLWIVTFFRLLMIPLLLIPFYFLQLTIPVLLTAILVSGTPSAPTMALYAQKYGGDRSFAALATFWTTLLSFITLPLLYLIVYILYGFK